MTELTEIYEDSLENFRRSIKERPRQEGVLNVEWVI